MTSLISQIGGMLAAPWQDFWEEFWGAATAIGTLALAVATLRVSRQAARDGSMAERHHRDLFKPILILKSTDVSSGRLSTVSVKDENRVTIRYEMPALLYNIGNGPALNLKITFESDEESLFDSVEGRGRVFSTLTPVEQNKSFHFVQSRDDGLTIDIDTIKPRPERNGLIAIRRIVKRSPQDMEKLFGSDIYISMYYDDVFQQKFLSKYKV
jgi:hypothetical protein